jgi:hypothetical protein
VTFGPGATVGYLGLQGSHDGDVPQASLALYEVASPEGGDPVPGEIVKSMMFVYDVAHFRWGGDAASDGATGKAASIARAYVGGFLLWHLLGETAHHRYFSGPELPGCISEPWRCGLAFEAPELFQQYREGAEAGGRRLVVHDFESAVSPSRLGPVVASGGSATLRKPFLGPDPAAGGAARHPAGTMEVVFSAPTSVDFAFDSPVDVTGFEVLSLRLSRPVDKAPGEGEAACRPASSQDLTVGVALGDGSSEHVAETSRFGRTPVPDFYWGIWPSAGTTGCNVEEHLRTIRIPLREFADGGVDLDHVAELRLLFDPAANGGGGRAVVDSIEFSASELDCDLYDECPEGVGGSADGPGQGSGGSGAATGDSGGTAAGDGGDAEPGCGCSTRGTAPASVLGLVLFLGARRRTGRVRAASRRSATRP